MPPKKSYAARNVREELKRELVDAPWAEYEVQIRDLHKFPIKAPPRAPANATRKRWLLLADAHFPFVDIPTWKVVLRACIDLSPDGLVIMGDWGDYATVTNHEKSEATHQRNLSLLKEFGECGNALDQLDDAATSAFYRYFLRGNHEWRVDRYLRSPVCPNNVRDLIPSIPKGLHLAERGYEYIVDKPVTLGTDHLFLHGHFFSKHHAARHLEALHSSCVYGHTHMPQQFTHSVPIGGGKRKTLVATGLPTMRDLQREWHEEHRVHTWVNGFGVMEFADGGDIGFAHNVYCVDGHASYGGFTWDAAKIKGGNVRGS